MVKQFQFSSTLQRMSVIVKSPDKPWLEVFCKGSPEKILSLSQPASIPEGIHAALKGYTEKGYRVIGLANRVLHSTYQSVSKTPRHEIEKDLNFKGLLVLENRLKPETTGIVQILKGANLKVVMITGNYYLIMEKQVKMESFKGIISRQLSQWPENVKLSMRTVPPSKFKRKVL